MRYITRDTKYTPDPNKGGYKEVEILEEGTLDPGCPERAVDVPTGGEIAIQVSPGVWIECAVSEWGTIKVIKGDRPYPKQEGAC